MSEITEEQKKEQKKREKAVENAHIATREMYKPENIKETREKSHTIMVQTGQKEKVVEERVYKNGVIKRRLKSLKKDGKSIFNRG